MTVLVTGATGFIGGRLTERLLARGDRVRLLVRRPEAAGRLAAAGAELAEGALEDEASLTSALQGVTTVFHCAGLATDWAPWADFLRVNVDGVRRLASCAARVPGLGRFVHLSSSDVYGYPKVACADDAPVKDVGLPYNRSKVLGEAALAEVVAATQLPCTVFRPATVYGPRSKDWAVEMGRLLQKKELPYVDGGRARAGLLYVDNLVDALFAAVATPQAVGRTYTLRDEGAQTWRDYLEALAAGLGAPPPSTSLPLWLVLPVGALSEAAWRLVGAKSRPLITRHAALVVGRDQHYGIARAVAELGFRSAVGFDEGVGRTLAWLRSAEGAAALSS